MAEIRIRPATSADVPLIITFIHELATYEKLAHEVVASEADMHAALFGERPVIEAVIASVDDVPAGTQFVVDFGGGQLAVAVVRRSMGSLQGLEFEVPLVDDGSGDLSLTDIRGVRSVEEQRQSYAL